MRKAGLWPSASKFLIDKLTDMTFRIARYFLFSAALTFPFLPAQAQKEKLNTREGNEQYKSGRYDQAILEYTEALEKNPEYTEALFNTGNALQEKSRRLFENAEKTEDPAQREALLKEAVELSTKAASQFAAVASKAKTREEKNKAQYNLGNARLFSGELEQSIEAYKEALRNNPEDDDARYNLAYAQHLLQKNQNEGEGGDQEQEPQQEKGDQDSQEENQRDQQNPQDEQNQQDQEKDQNQQEQESSQPDELTKEEAEKLLEALSREEKNLQEQLKKDKHKATRIRVEKDW